MSGNTHYDSDIVQCLYKYKYKEPKLVDVLSSQLQLKVTSYDLRCRHGLWVWDGC